MKRKLKICSPQLGLNPNSDLGGEVHDHFILQGLANRGHKILVYLPKDRPYQKHENIIVSRTPIKHIPAFLFNLLVIPYLFKTYKKEKFDILRVHNPYFVGLGVLFFRLFHPNVPVVAVHHLVERSFLYDLINKITVSKYDALISVSSYVKSWLIEKYKTNNNKAFVIYNGVAREFRPTSKNPKILKKYSLANKFTILFMGFLIERKNPMFLLELYKKIKSIYKNTALVICGRGPLKGKMKLFVNQNRLSDVIFTGTVYGKAKLDFFNLCDVFLLPSKNEGFGLVIAEAMACSKPVIIPDLWSANEAITDGEEGFLATPNDLEDWYNKTIKLIKDRKLRVKMGEKAQARIREKFSWNKSALENERLFFKLVHNVS